MKMGSESTVLDFDIVRAFKKDLQEMLERDSRGKAGRSVDRRAHATPRGAGIGDDVFGMFDSTIPNTPLQHRSTKPATKRKAAFETPAVPKFSKADGMSSPTDGRANGQTSGLPSAPFSERPNAGQIVETLNGQLPAFEPPLAPAAEARVKLTANTDLKKFFYKPLAMHLSEASEVLDDRIDQFQTLIQTHHNLEDSAFGSAASQSTNEVIAVGRVACDSPDGRLNAASLLLEMSRRGGAGLRIPLNVEKLSYQFFPGQIIAVRGINASGSYFSVSEILEMPLPPPVVNQPAVLSAYNARLGLNEGDTSNANHALNVTIASGPYTSDDNLSFEPLHALCEQAADSYADVLVLIGPILDVDHPLLASGDFDLPDDPSIQPDKATLNDVFRLLIGTPISALAQRIPNITIVMIPSVRDAVNKHVSWPQEPFDRKVLGLPKQAKVVSNPVTFSLNESMVAINASDVLYDLRSEEVVIGHPKDNSLLSRLPRHLIEQRHFYPLFPPVDRSTADGVATGMPLDLSYLKLGEWLNVKPDLLITPSTLPPFGKVRSLHGPETGAQLTLITQIVESVLVVNPGSLSKRKGPGTYAQLAIHPRHITSQEQTEKMIPHNLYDRARVDIVRI